MYAVAVVFAAPSRSEKSKFANKRLRLSFYCEAQNGEAI